MGFIESIVFLDAMLLLSIWVYKKDPSWFAVLWEAWRILSVQNYNYFLKPQKIFRIFFCLMVILPINSFPYFAEGASFGAFWESCILASKKCIFRLEVHFPQANGKESYKMGLAEGKICKIPHLALSLCLSSNKGD